MFRKLATSLGFAPQPPKTLTATFGKKKLKIELDEDDFEDAKLGVTVKFLRDKIAEAIEHDPAQVTLVCAGKKLTNDKAFLVDYGIADEAKILVIASTQKAPKKIKIRAAPPKAAPAPPKERVQKVEETAQTELEPMVVAFEQSVKTMPETEAKDEQHKLSELVLQKIFALDDVDVSEDQDLRVYRKEVINKMHKLHKRVDVAYEQRKEPLGNAPDTNTKST